MANKRIPALPVHDFGRAKIAIEGMFLLLLFKIAQTGYEAYHLAFMQEEDKQAELHRQWEKDPSLVTTDNIIAAVSVGVTVYAFVFFLRWMYQACRTINTLEAKGVLFSPGMAIGGWFIPGANFYIPYKALQQAWEQTGLLYNEEPYEEKEKSPVGAWWFFWVTATLIPVFAVIIKVRASEAERALVLPKAQLIIMVGALCRLIAIFLTINVIRRISAREKLLMARVKAVNESPGPTETI